MQTASNHHCFDAHDTAQSLIYFMLRPPGDLGSAKHLAPDKLKNMLLLCRSLHKRTWHSHEKAHANRNTCAWGSKIEIDPDEIDWIFACHNYLSFSTQGYIAICYVTLYVNRSFCGKSKGGPFQTRFHGRGSLAGAAGLGQLSWSS